MMFINMKQNSSDVKANKNDNNMQYRILRFRRSRIRDMRENVITPQ